MINAGLMSSNTPEWATPQWLFDILNSIYCFTLDPCSTHENTKCPKHYTREDDGLSLSWKDETVFMNPPYGSKIGKWVEKCSRTEGECRVALLPARTDTRWFHEYIYGRAKIYFIRGRLKFGDGKGPAPFPSMVVVWGGSEEQYKRMILFIEWSRT